MNTVWFGNEWWFSPLLEFIDELPENGPSEVVWQTVGHVVFDEGFNESLEGVEVKFIHRIYMM